MLGMTFRRRLDATIPDLDDRGLPRLPGSLLTSVGPQVSEAPHRRLHRVAQPFLSSLCYSARRTGYTFTRSPDAADLSIAAMTSWRRTASAKSGTV